MISRTLFAAAALLGLAAPAIADTGCPLERAIYTEKENGFELRFRHGESWEMGGMTKAVYDLYFPDGKTVLWGYVSSNMGTSRDEGHLFSPECRRPGPEDAGSSQEELEACSVWNNVIYDLVDGDVDFMPLYDEPAPERLLLSDLGRKVRYSLFIMGPGDEPWDVFTFKACTP